MSLRQDRDRREAAREAAIERSKVVRQFDNRVAELFAEGLSVRETARRLDCSPAKVQASRVWLMLDGIGAGHLRNVSSTVRILREAANG